MDNPYLEKDIKELLDYSFIVFPAAKAYEGFLKKLFLNKGFITEDDYYGKRFRIGKALNPYLEKEIREESVYDKVVEYCGGKALADFFWETWRQCRNTVTLPEARQKLEMIIKAIDEALKECNTR